MLPRMRRYRHISFLKGKASRLHKDVVKMCKRRYLFTNHDKFSKINLFIYFYYCAIFTKISNMIFTHRRNKTSLQFKQSLSVPCLSICIVAFGVVSPEHFQLLRKLITESVCNYTNKFPK